MPPLGKPAGDLQAAAAELVQPRQTPPALSSTRFWIAATNSRELALGPGGPAPLGKLGRRADRPGRADNARRPGRSGAARPTAAAAASRSASRPRRPTTRIVCADQVAERQRVAEPDQPGGDLHVKDPAGDRPGLEPADPQVLARGMHDDLDRRVGHYLPERREVAHGQRRRSPPDARAWPPGPGRGPARTSPRRRTRCRRRTGRSAQVGNQLRKVGCRRDQGLTGRVRHRAAHFRVGGESRTGRPDRSLARDYHAWPAGTQGPDPTTPAESISRSDSCLFIGRTRSSTYDETPLRHRRRTASHPAAARTRSAAQPARSSESRAWSAASTMAAATYCSGVSAISSGSPTFERMLTPPRPTAVRPASVITGTPIQSASSVLVWPL